MEGKPEDQKQCGCGSGSGCNCKSSGCGGCGGRAIKYLTPLLIGGIIGYMIGGNCAAHKKACAMPGNAMMMTQPNEAPAAPPMHK